MKPHSSLTPEEFERLLDWLAPDTERAAAKYEVIRRGLIQRFINRRCVDAEGLADETINRVASRLPELAETYKGEPARYFHGVAKKVFLEHCRQQRLERRPLPPQPEPRFAAIYHECLEKCLAELPPDQRDLILQYYAEIKKAKIESHKEMQRQLNLKADALRVRTFRIRQMLGACVRDCVEREAGSNEMAYYS